MGLFEMLLIAVVALVVVGPEKMPEAVRNVVLTLGRFKRSFNNIRSDFEQQLGTDEIREQLHKETVVQNLSKLKDDVEEVNRAFESSSLSAETTSINSSKNSPSATKSNL